MISSWELKSVVVVPYELTLLRKANIIDDEQHTNLYKMVMSRDKEMNQLVLTITNSLRAKRLENEKNKKTSPVILKEG